MYASLFSHSGSLPSGPDEAHIPAMIANGITPLLPHTQVTTTERTRSGFSAERSLTACPIKAPSIACTKANSMINHHVDNFPNVNTSAIFTTVRQGSRRLTESFARYICVGSVCLKRACRKREESNVPLLSSKAFLFWTTQHQRV